MEKEIDLTSFYFGLAKQSWHWSKRLIWTFSAFSLFVVLFLWIAAQLHLDSSMSNDDVKIFFSFFAAYRPAVMLKRYSDNWLKLNTIGE